MIRVLVDAYLLQVGPFHPLRAEVAESHPCLASEHH